jgi:hypothetical protein
MYKINDILILSETESKKLNSEIKKLKLRHCKYCNKIDSLDNFYSNNIHKSCCKKLRKLYYQQNRDKKLDYTKRYAQNNKEKIKAYKQSYKLNPDNKLLMNSYFKNKRDNDKLYRIAHAIRNRIKSIFNAKNWKKSQKFKDYLGCSVQELIVHIENKFKPGMTWDNHGEWHIDHIVPLSSGKTEEELYKLNHYTNLQPLWAKENLSKGKKISL